MGRDVRMFATASELAAVQEVRELARQLEERVGLLKGAVRGTPGLMLWIEEAQRHAADAFGVMVHVEETVKEDAETPFPCEKCGTPASAWVGDTCEPCSEGDARSDVEVREPVPSSFLPWVEA